MSLRRLDSPALTSTSLMSARPYSIAALLLAGGVVVGGALRAQLSGGVEAHVIALALVAPTIAFVLRAPRRAALASLGFLCVAAAALPFYPLAVWGLVGAAGAVVFATRSARPLATWEPFWAAACGLLALAVASGALLRGAPRSLPIILGGLVWASAAYRQGGQAGLRAGVGLASLGALVGGLDFFSRASGSAEVLFWLALSRLWVGTWRRGRLWWAFPFAAAACAWAGQGALSEFGWGALAGGALFVGTLLVPSSARRAAARGLGVAALALLAWAVIALARYLVAAHPHAGGVDFYFFVCLARDRLLCPELVPDMQYVYSPGVYAFWGWVSRVSASLSWLRAVILGLLVVDAGLVLWIVARATRSWGLGALGALACLRLMTRFEGLEGTTEPLIVLPVLLGVALWGGSSLTGRKGLLRAVALGAGLGLAIYAKQQGVFLALAAGLFLLGPWTRPRVAPAAIALGLGAIAAVSLAGFWAEGKGSAPLERAFFLATEYRQEATWGENLATILRADPALGWGGLLCLVGAGFALRRLTRKEGAPLDWVLIFAAAAFAGSLLQFTRRPYLHYAQVGLPFLVIAAVLSGFTLWERWDRSRIGGRVLAIWAGLALCAGGLAPATFGLRLPGEALVFPTRWEEGVAQDLDRIQPAVAEGSELLLLPPRRNVLHYRLGTRSVESPLSYGWGWEMGLRLEELPWAKIRYVLVLRRPEDRGLIWERYGCGALEEALPEHGYELKARTTSLDLWERVP